MYGIEQSEKFIVSVAKVYNVIDAFVVGKKGLLVLLGLPEPVEELRRVDFNKLLLELKEYELTERIRLESAFKSALSLTNKAIEKKIEDGVSILEDAIVAVAKAISLYEDAVILIEKIKILFATEKKLA